MNKKLILIIARLLFGSLTLIAIVTQAIYLQQNGVLNPFNYLGYFTNLSNIVAGVILVISALYLMRRRKPSVKDDLIRGAATLYMTITGLIYVTLLSGEDLGLLMPWVNIVTHIILPLYVLVDWMYQPPLSRLRVKQIAVWLVWPIVYVTYTLIRGSITGWYPYPFLNPDKVEGYGGVFIYCIAILAVSMLLGWLLVKLSNVFKRQVS
ncbi:MAG TPA: Pr6Pr family membrane protein [Candidatus Saccharimonadales bacterium]|nr:Pr6Pr family membrane protein [Candidatus Saccharimonadales bacterium]